MQIVTLTDVEQKTQFNLGLSISKKKKKKNPPNYKSYNKRNVVDYAKLGLHAGQLSRFSAQRNNLMRQQKLF